MRLPCVLLVLAVLMGVAAAGEASLDQQAAQAFARSDYAAAETLCRQILAERPKDANTQYNLACALARQGQGDAAMAALARAQELGFADAEHTRADDDLASLRQLPAFTALVAKMASAPYAADQPYEPGADIPGVRALEGEADGGLRWRLRIGAQATAAHPHRLVVWLHPSGGSANKPVEALAPALAERGFALVVFTQKQFLYWSEGEMQRVVATIRALAAVDGLDVAKPILMGFSAGGQASLELWHATPEAWGGLILDAAYPVEVGGDGRPRGVRDPSDAAVAAKVPIIALVGDQDPGLRFWHEALERWQGRELPITLRPVAGRGHEFLLAGADWEAVLAWLQALPAAGAPAARPAAPEPAIP